MFLSALYRDMIDLQCVKPAPVSSKVLSFPEALGLAV